VGLPGVHGRLHEPPGIDFAKLRFGPQLLK
jgi:hypothetical protein